MAYGREAPAQMLATTLDSMRYRGYGKRIEAIHLAKKTALRRR